MYLECTTDRGLFLGIKPNTKEAALSLSRFQVFSLRWGWFWVHLFISLSLCFLTYELRESNCLTARSSLDRTSFVLAQLGEILVPCLPMPWPTFRPSLGLLSLSRGACPWLWLTRIILNTAGHHLFGQCSPHTSYGLHFHVLLSSTELESLLFLQFTINTENTKG